MARPIKCGIDPLSHSTEKWQSSQPADTRSHKRQKRHDSPYRDEPSLAMSSLKPPVWVTSSKYATWRLPESMNRQVQQSVQEDAQSRQAIAPPPGFVVQSGPSRTMARPILVPGISSITRTPAYGVTSDGVESFLPWERQPEAPGSLFGIFSVAMEPFMFGQSMLI
jgi:hypothetical protein